MGFGYGHHDEEVASIPVRVVTDHATSLANWETQNALRRQEKAIEDLNAEIRNLREVLAQILKANKPSKPTRKVILKKCKKSTKRA